MMESSVFHVASKAVAF